MNNPTTLVVGASGATGKQLVDRLLSMRQKVRIIVRSSANIPDTWQKHDRLSIITANISEMRLAEMAAYTQDCQAVASCLGHNISLKGIYGKPRKLVTDSVKLLCAAIEENSPEQAVKFVLMNTAGNRNRAIDEAVSFGQKLLIGLIRMLLPPHVDNEQAADYLRINIGQKHPSIEWVAVRPDSLIDEDKVTDYQAYPSPIRSAIFNPGKTSRINVGHFMAKLITDDMSWNQWKGQMPVIYNTTYT